MYAGKWWPVSDLAFVYCDAFCISVGLPSSLGAMSGGLVALAVVLCELFPVNGPPVFITRCVCWRVCARFLCNRFNESVMTVRLGCEPAGSGDMSRNWRLEVLKVPVTVVLSARGRHCHDCPTSWYSHWKHPQQSQRARGCTYMAGECITISV